MAARDQQMADQETAAQQTADQETAAQQTADQETAAQQMADYVVMVYPAIADLTELWLDGGTGISCCSVDNMLACFWGAE